MKRKLTGKNDEGVALILALLFVVLLTVLVVEFCYESQVEASYTANQSTGFEAYLAAKSGVARGMGLLAEDILESQGGASGTGPDRDGSMFDQRNTGGSSNRQGASSGRGTGSTGARYKQLSGGSGAGDAPGGGKPPGGTPGGGTGGQPGQEENPYAGFFMDSLMDPVPWHYGIPFEPLNDALMRTTIADEYGKINLNALLMREGETDETGEPVEGGDDGASTGTVRQQLVDILINFLQYRSPDSETPPEAIVDAILDWVDYDDNDEERPEGAEKEYYEGLEIPYAIKNGPMDSIEELLLIKGMTPELYYGDPEEEQLPLSEYLTVHGDWQGRININTAPLEVLQSAFEMGGGDPAVAEEVYEQVRIDQPYTDMQQVQGLLPEAEPDPAEEDPRERQRRQQIAQQQGRDPAAQQSITARIFTVSSNVFRIYGDGMYEDTLVRVIAYVYRSGGGDTGGGEMAGAPPEEPFRVLSWSVIR